MTDFPTQASWSSEQHGSLGLDKSASAAHVVVALSGGVDSAVVAALLRAEGYRVTAITLQLYDQGKSLGRKGGCCAGRDIYDAKAVARQLDIPHYVLNYEQQFERDVIDDFTAGYLHGQTPIPCVRCNQRIKFGSLLNAARELEADALATGHYVRRLIGTYGAELWRGRDAARDQSYFLFTTTRSQLNFLRFPLGAMTKSQTRLLADDFALPVAKKVDSQDICFVSQGSYAEVVKERHERFAKYRGNQGQEGLGLQRGEIIDLEGKVLGYHSGTVHYTIGQRRGLGIGGRQGRAEQAWYVVDLHPERRQVVVGPRSALARRKLFLREVHWLGPAPIPEDGLELEVRFRSIQPLIAAHLLGLPDRTAQVSFDTPQYGIARGQACVFYQRERLLGGGWITDSS